MQAPFYVSTFDIDNENFTLSNLIKDNINVELEEVTQKKQLGTITDILRSLRTKTMVCENEYTDNGYLDDFLNYYVGCHENYPKTCSRIHFFKGDFDYDTFESVIESEVQDVKGLGEYLGFMVIKPIPMTFIGRTCLKIPEKYTSNQMKVITRVYTADLFGLKLEVESLAFQEQDQVVSACTSASIWCLLHALKFRKIKSPAQITLAATEHNKIINTFPSSGLNSVEIERALESFSLRQYTISPKVESRTSLKELVEHVETYINSGIPLILGVECLTKSDANPYKVIGEHAVTIVGYGKDNYGRLDQLIVHDDRKGPFTVLRFVPDYPYITEQHDITDVTDAQKVTILVNDTVYQDVENKDSPDFGEVMVYNNLIIATDPRVRIGFYPIAQTVDGIKSLLDITFNNMAADAGVENTSEILTSIKLLKSSEYKDKVKASTIIKKVDVLTSNFPKYLWVAEFLVDGHAQFDLVFDSSCLPQGNAFLCSACFNESSLETLNILAKSHYNYVLKEKGMFVTHEPDFITQVLRSIKAKPKSHFNYLDSVFGRPLMPKLIKQTEIASEQINIQDRLLVLLHSFDNKNAENPDRFKALLDKQMAFDYEWDKSDISNVVKVKAKTLIWLISEYGALFVGEDSKATGHPTLTGAKPARIGGEFIEKSDKPGTIIVNCFSGRYSTNFGVEQDKMGYLKNAMAKINDILGRHQYTFEIDERLNN